MNGYYVEFRGELKDNKVIQRRFVAHYNKVCDLVNEQIPLWNEEFDKNWTGEPITDYWENEAYMKWMLKHHEELLTNNKLQKDFFLEYKYDQYLQLYAIGRFGSFKNQKISFVIRKG